MNRQRPLPTTFQAFYHLACLPEWQPIFHEQLDGFCAANLRPACFVLGTDEDRQYVERHLPVIGHENNFGWYETPTLDALWRWSRENPGGAALYCHSKGVSKPQDEGKACWRRLMARGIISPWQANLAKLERCDAAGVNFCRYLGHPYFEGNTWIARNDWIAHLPAPWEHRATARPGWMRPERIHAEAWPLCRPYHVVESLICQNDALWNSQRCAELLALASQPGPLPPPDSEIRRKIRHPGAIDGLPEPLKGQVDAILRGCGCKFRESIDPLLPQLRPYFTQTG
jgi:hypothetical protein